MADDFDDPHGALAEFAEQYPEQADAMYHLAREYPESFRKFRRIVGSVPGRVTEEER